MAEVGCGRDVGLNVLILSAIATGALFFTLDGGDFSTVDEADEAELGGFGSAKLTCFLEDSCEGGVLFLGFKLLGLRFESTLREGLRLCLGENFFRATGLLNGSSSGGDAC